MLLGASITAIELPTAFPYFAAIAAVVGSGVEPGPALGLLLIFNLCFVLPLIGIWLVLSAAGPRSERLLGVGRRFLERRWPHILAILVMVIGGLIVLDGTTALIAQGHGGFPRLIRHIRHIVGR